MSVARLADSVQEVHAGPAAPLVSDLLARLKDIDGQRIAKDDAFVIRKGVLALIGIVADLEARISALEQARSEPTAR